MGSSDEQATNDTLGPSTGAAMTPGSTASANPYLSDLLDSILVDVSNGEVVERQLFTHQLRVRPDGRTGRAVIDGYDNLGPSRTTRSQLRLSCAISFQIGDTATTACDAGSIHVLDDSLMFVGSGGNLGPSPMPDTASYVLVAPPDLVVAIERLVGTNAANRPELAGFRVVLVNPIQQEPLVVVTSGLDQRALATLVAAGERFMREQVGSRAGWRRLTDGWETLEWNGAPAAASSAPSAAANPSAAVAAAGVSTAGTVAAGSTAGPRLTAAGSAAPATTTATTAPGTLPATTPAPTLQPRAADGDDASGRSSRRLLLLGALAVVAMIVVGVAWAASRGDDDGTTAAGGVTTASSTVTTEAPDTATTASTTTTSEPQPTTTESTTTTTEPEPTTTEVTGPQPVSESEQLAVWGFTEPIELDAPSGDAVCPAGEPSVKATVVGVRAALNVRDGADSSYEIVQRLVLGYDDVDVYPEVTQRSARGTNWVTIALAQPPGSTTSDRRCGWAATQFLDYTE